MTRVVSGLRDYLLERVVKAYVQNVEQVLPQISISRLLFGSCRIDEVHLNPEAGQDLLFSYLFYGCEIISIKGFDVELSADWLSIASKSIRLHIPVLKAELLCHDPNDMEAATTKAFSDAQKLRGKAEALGVATPPEAGTLYKVSGGLDIVVDAIEVSIRLSEHDEPRLGASLGGMRYCPATSHGVPTTDIDAAIRPQPLLREVGYSYHFEIASLDFAVLPHWPEDTWDAEANLSVAGFVLTSMGQVAAFRKRETLFYISSVLGIEIQEVRTPFPVTVERLVSLVAVLSRIFLSDNLRGDVIASAETETSPEVCSSAQVDDDHSPTCDQADSDDDAVLHERLRERTERERDMAHLLEGVTRTSRKHKVDRRSNTVVHGAVPPTVAETGITTGGDGADPDAESLGDSDDFRDCEEFGLLVVPSPASQEATTADSGREPERVLLKRFAFGISQCELQVVGANGTLGVELAKFGHSSDNRCELTMPQLKSMRTLFELPEEWLLQSRPPAPGREVGSIYAGLHLGTMLVAFERADGSRSELVKLEGGLSLRHRGRGEPCLVKDGPRQLLEVELAGLSLCDGNREEVEAIGRALAAAVTPSPEGPAPETPAQSEVSMPIFYSLEAVNVCIEAGPTFGQESWHCSLPCVRLRNVFDDFHEIWDYTLSGLSVTRALADPLGATVAFAEPILQLSSGSNLWAPTALPRGSGRKAIDIIASLEGQIEQGRIAAASDRERTKRLEGKLVEIFEMVQQLPDGPMPLALHHLLATVVSGEASRAAMPVLPEVETATYELDVGQDAQHVIKGLQRGEVVEWVMQEVQELTVDVTAVLRSGYRLHSARRLRDTVRTSRCRDCFEVTDDFEDAQLPLTLEIRMSNAFSWWASKSVCLQLSRVAIT